MFSVKEIEVYRVGEESYRIAGIKVEYLKGLVGLLVIYILSKIFF